MLHSWNQVSQSKQGKEVKQVKHTDGRRIDGVALAEAGIPGIQAVRRPWLGKPLNILSSTWDLNQGSTNIANPT